MRKWILASGAIAIVCASIGVETGRGQGGGGGGVGGVITSSSGSAGGGSSTSGVGSASGGGVTHVNVVPVELPGGSTPDPFAQRPGVGGGGGGFSRSFVNVATSPQVSNEARELQIQIRQLTQKLRDATDDTSKADLTKQLDAAVGKYFDEDMKGRESQLSQLEERVTKLRSQLDRRRKAKDDITKLQTQVLVNDADGLGFGDFPMEHSGTLNLNPPTFNLTAPQPTVAVPGTINFQAVPATPGALPGSAIPAPTPAPARR
jgi:hypothetical protein